MFGCLHRFQDKLEYHVDETRCKLSKSLSIPYKASNVLDSHYLYIIYCTIMMSVLILFLNLERNI